MLMKKEIMADIYGGKLKMTKHEKIKMYYRTVKNHRKYVALWCRKMGIFWQGVVHDLSKYSKRERNIYLYYGMGRSPHEIARQELGYSPSWLYHKNHNKHHWEFWLDNEERNNLCEK